MANLISLRHICKWYRTAAGTVRALDDVSLSIEQGEFTAIVGRSGSGKSTLMNILGCLDFPTSGRYYLGGRDISRFSAKAQARVRGTQIGFVFQGFHLLPSLTAQENVELPLLYRGVPRAERVSRARKSLRQVGLEQRTNHRPSELSGGQQQRVAIARAIAMAPPLILADEPTGNLDTAAGGEVMDLLHALNDDGHTVVLITHDPNIAQSVSRRICIQDGRICE